MIRTLLSRAVRSLAASAYGTVRNTLIAVWIALISGAAIALLFEVVLRATSDRGLAERITGG